MLEIKYVGTIRKEKSEAEYVIERYSVGHYTVSEGNTFYKDGSSYKRIVVSCNEEWSRTFYPDIYYNDDYFGDGKPYFSVQTTSYGALNIEDFGEFVKAQKHALEVVKALNKKFIGE